MVNWILILSILFLPAIIVYLAYEEKGKYKFIYTCSYVLIACIIIIAILHNNKNEMKKLQSNIYVQTPNVEKNIKECGNDEDSYNDCNQDIDQNKIETIVVEDINKTKIASNKQKDQSKCNNKIQTKEYSESNNQEELIIEFKEDLYGIEEKALIPLRKSYDILKKIKSGNANIKDLYEEANIAKEKCELAEKAFVNLDVPYEIDEENRNILYDAKLDLQKAYYLRGIAMENGLEFLNSKNPKYIIKCKNELKLADKLIFSCVDKLNKVKSNIDK